MHPSSQEDRACIEKRGSCVFQEDNSLTALGTALAMVGRYFAGGRLLQSGSSELVRTWAVVPPGANLTIILLNKALTATQQVDFIPALYNACMYSPFASCSAAKVPEASRGEMVLPLC